MSRGSHGECRESDAEARVVVVATGARRPWCMKSHSSATMAKACWMGRWRTTVGTRWRVRGEGEWEG
jgi:hypothetical protein